MPLSSLDHIILQHLSLHRVLTTTQLTEITSSPLRTVTYRLDRLHRARLVGRTRPYADAGSAPLHWWPTEAGSETPAGIRPSHARRTLPNPMFLAHTVAVADFWLALTSLGPDVGLRPTKWIRDEESWEEWHALGGSGRVAPDAFAEIAVGKTGEIVPVFVEVDLATMSQPRLRAKLRRYVAYAKDAAWEGSHPACPVLLLLTTSEARATGFLAAADKLRPRRLLSACDGDDAGLVAAAAAFVHDPAAAVRQAVWQLSGEGRLVSLESILVRQASAMRRRRAAEQAASEKAERQTPIDAIFSFRGSITDIYGALEDDDAVEMLKITFTRNPNDLARWALAYRDLVLRLESWWDERRRTSERRPDLETQRAHIADQLRAMRDTLHSEQTAIVDAAAGAEHLDDPRLRAVRRRLTRGMLLSFVTLDLITEHPKSRAEYDREMTAGYAEAREEAVQAQWREFSWLQRMRTSVDVVRTEYDTQHLLTCEDCAVVRPGGRLFDRYSCEVCGGHLSRFHPEAVSPDDWR